MYVLLHSLWNLLFFHFNSVAFFLACLIDSISSLWYSVLCYTLQKISHKIHNFDSPYSPYLLYLIVVECFNLIYGCIVAVTLSVICHLGPYQTKMGTIMFHMYSIVDNINLFFILFLRVFAYYPGSHSVSCENNQVCIYVYQ